FLFLLAEDGIRAFHVTGVQTCALPILMADRASTAATCRCATLPDILGLRPRSFRPTSTRRRPGLRARQRDGSLFRVPISQSLKPGDADHFLLRVGTNKSATFELEFTFVAAGGEQIPGDSVSVEIFVPRTPQPAARLVAR